MFHTSVSSDQLDGRLDSEFFQPSHYEKELAVVRSPIPKIRLQSLAAPGTSITYGIVQPGQFVEPGMGARMIRCVDIARMTVKADQILWVSPEIARSYARSSVRPRDVLIGIAGTLGCIGVAPTNIEPANLNQSVARLRVDVEAGHDPEWVAAFLACRYGQALLLRRSVGSVQQHLNLADLPSIAVLCPTPAVRKYVGDKVRLAERLRGLSGELSEYAIRTTDAYMSGFERARDLEKSVAAPQGTRLPEVLLATAIRNGEDTRRTSRVTMAHLTSRLDCSFYARHAMEVDERLSQGYRTAALADIVDPSRLITNGVRGPDFQASRFKLVRLQDRDGWSIDFDKCASISEAQFWENRRCELREGDVVVAIGGYIGHAAIVRRVQPAVIGQHSALIPMRDGSEVDAGFLVAYFCSRDGAAHLQRYVSGTVQAGINLEDLRELRVPMPTPEFQSHVGDTVRRADDLSIWSRRLACAAMRLVDALIEQKVSEAELVEAQHALEGGDGALDRGILARLSASGIDLAEESPLFPDLDAMCSAIEDLNCAELGGTEGA